MTLERLNCRGFRNLEETTWEPGAGSHLLYGPNGAGKTSLLEAVYLLATTRSFRTTRLTDCPSHGETGFDLGGRVVGDERRDLAFSWEPGRRSRLVNGSQSTLAGYLEVLPVVAWTAADNELLTGSPGVRRRFMDQGVVGLRPGSIEVVSRYRRALDQKRELLARGGRGLVSWNEVLAEPASELVRLRREYVELLSTVLAGVLEEGSLGIGPIELDYRPSPASVEDGAKAMLAALERVRGREREARMPLVGPHRDDLDLTWSGRPVRAVASAGERKLIGLGLTAARGRVLARRGREPLYLLDDLDAELDREHLDRVRTLFSVAPQVFVTSSRSRAWEGWEGLARWRISGGKTDSGRFPQLR